MVLTSLNHEQRARYGYAISLQIINGREVPGSARDFTEEAQGIIERNTRGGHDWNIYINLFFFFKLSVMFL